MRRFALAVSVSLAAVGSSRADILPPGAKWVNHVAKFENIADFPEYVFYVYPRDLDRRRRGNSSVRLSESGEVYISGFNPLAAGGGIFLFAVPKKLQGDPERPPAEEWFTGNVAGVLKSKPLVAPIRSISKFDERDRIVTRYRISIQPELELLDLLPQLGVDEEATRFEAPQTQTTRVIVSGLFSWLPGRKWHWIVGGAATGAALVCACWLALRKKVQSA